MSGRGVCWYQEVLGGGKGVFGKSILTLGAVSNKVS
jgi:hypothetical protein